MLGKGMNITPFPSSMPLEWEKEWILPNPSLLRHWSGRGSEYYPIPHYYATGHVIKNQLNKGVANAKDLNDIKFSKRKNGGCVLTTFPILHHWTCNWESVKGFAKAA